MKHTQRKIRVITNLSSKTNIDKSHVIDIHCLQINNLKLTTSLSTYQKNKTNGNRNLFTGLLL